MVIEVQPLPPDAPDPGRETWIRKTPGVCSGDACVRNTRIMVWLLEAYRRNGLTNAEILGAYPDLTEEDLALAFHYAASNPDEIEESLHDGEAE